MVIGGKFHTIAENDNPWKVQLEDNEFAQIPTAIPRGVPFSRLI